MSQEQVTLKEVKTRKERRIFVDFPNQLYQNSSYFVPAFFGDDMADWNPKKNPAFEYCEARMWLAYQGGKVVGRIGAILSHRSNEKWHTRRMRFSQVDFIDDPAVSDALFAAVENWAREKGMEEVHGPLGFCDLDREGMLVEGFDRRSMFITYYNHPYYLEHMARLGYVKDADWLEYFIPVPPADDPKALRIKRIGEHVLKRGHFHEVKVTNRLAYKPWIKQAFELVNEAYGPLYGTVDLGPKQIDKYATKFIPLIEPDLCCLIADQDNRLVAFGVCGLSMAEAMRKCRGHLFPTGWVQVLKSLRHNDAMDMFLIAVKPSLQGTGLNGAVMSYLWQGAMRRGIKIAETGPMLEMNEKVLAQWKTLDLTQHKRRRCFVKKLS
ncbi:MAG: hypothetical protein J6P72_07475 [Firmicutes bacterium]|nr:hypothetical protein [Bacillota bacterium]